MPSHALYYAQWQFGLFMTVVTKRSLQQRDCSGLAPNSLFTHGETTIRLRTKSSAKVQTFFHLQRKNATKIEIFILYVALLDDYTLQNKGFSRS